MKRTRARSINTRQWLRAAVAVMLLLASSAAAALGLGQIELKSKLGEPLLAEIPIISNDPRELQRLSASLASPETFARIGLQPPDQVVSNLQFVSALDGRGNPVIRVTSRDPITQPLLTFLIEVDWGQGKLVREYSVLLDTPRTVAAPLQPPIQAPQAAPSNTIEREPPPAPPVQPEPAQPRPARTGPAEPTPAEAVPAAPEPQPEPEVAATPRPVATEPAPPAPPAPMPPPAPAPASVPHTYGEVRSGETLSEIASSLDLGVSLDQAMIALLRANPRAFIDENINLLKRGVVLRVPDREELAAIDAVQASALVRSQIRQWQQARQAVPQPVAAAGGAAGEAPAGEGAADETAAAAPDARLEIVPPGASEATAAGTQSGIAAGGEGDMQRELATTKESLAAREAELAEMKSRVAELEDLQAKQQQLLEMKDTELTAVQQRLAETRGDEAQPGSWLPWVVGIAIGLLAALLIGWLLRRRSGDARFRVPNADVPARPSLAEAFVPVPPAADDAPAAQPSAAAPAPVAPSADDPPVAAAPAATPTATGPAPVPPPATPQLFEASGPVEPSRPSGPAGGDHPVDPADEQAPAEADEPGQPPFWDRRQRDPLPSKRAPTWHSDPAVGAAAGMAEGHSTGEVSSQERLELARAYLDLGDHDSARQLLDEVAGHGDPAARQQAERMLRELGK